MRIAQKQKEKLDEDKEQKWSENDFDDIYLTSLKVEEQKPEDKGLRLKVSKLDWDIEMAGASSTAKLVFEIVSQQVNDYTLNIAEASKLVAEMMDKKYEILQKRNQKQRDKIEELKRENKKTLTKLAEMAQMPSTNNERIFFECVSAAIKEAEERRESRTKVKSQLNINSGRHMQTIDESYQKMNIHELPTQPKISRLSTNLNASSVYIEQEKMRSLSAIPKPLAAEISHYDRVSAIEKFFSYKNNDVINKLYDFVFQKNIPKDFQATIEENEAPTEFNSEQKKTVKSINLQSETKTTQAKLMNTLHNATPQMFDLSNHNQTFSDQIFTIPSEPTYQQSHDSNQQTKRLLKDNLVQAFNLNTLHKMGKQQ